MDALGSAATPSGSERGKPLAAGGETRLRSFFGNGVGPVLAIALIFYIWLVSQETWRMFDREHFGDVFDQLALSMVHGRFDLPPKVIFGEAIVIDGRHYGYWGPFPAILRLPLAVFGEGEWVGRTARCSCVAAAMASLVAVAGIMREIIRRRGGELRARWFPTAVLFAIASGTTLPFLVGRAYVYHESILWGSAMADLFLWLGLRVLRTGRLTTALAALFCAAASVLSRPTIGYGMLAGAFLIIAWLGWRHRKEKKEPWRTDRRWRALAALLLCWAVLSGLPFLYNYVRFGTFMRFPMEHYVAATPERIRITKNGHYFQTVNILPNLWTYFDPSQIRITPRFPYFLTKTYVPSRRQRIEHVEPHAGVIACMAGIFILATAGWYRAARDCELRLLLAGTVLSAVLIGSFAAISFRYIHDLSPLLYFGAAIGGVSLAGAAGRWSRILRLALLPLFLISAAQFMAFTIFYQRLGVPDSTFDQQMRFSSFITDVDAGIRRFFGIHGRTPPAGQAEHFFFDLTLPKSRTAGAHPLLAIGRINAANIIFLVPGEGDWWHVAADVWGLPLRIGKGLRYREGTVRVEITLNRADDEIEVQFDDEPAQVLLVRPFPFAGLPAHVGTNPFGGSWASPDFDGTIRLVERR